MDLSWNPFPEYRDFSFQAIHDDSEGFRILLEAYCDKISNKQALRVRFPLAGPMYYHRVDEGFLLSPESTIGNPAATFQQTKASDLIERFHMFSCNIYRESSIVHYCIYTANECIEVLSEFEPVCEYLSRLKT
ncbi:hypothetical protein ACJJIE_21685 [Microbulbifer sp. TRSA001]|uniref:hypothetical protein n=1 Tax=Microbulbifer sp. TRSA001 TaxID=3243381 RepID=UPI004039E4A1